MDRAGAIRSLPRRGFDGHRNYLQELLYGDAAPDAETVWQTTADDSDPVTDILSAPH
ncbi:hypothetical protein AB0395_12345 [Streptosporangium sp. NPDC051023]|uniref:hypothetical protein n=1 Tax=Streptosporangium sp. NPDC051023 TaxID=3155410 RepID=UPI00344D124A